MDLHIDTGNDTKNFFKARELAIIDAFKKRWDSYYYYCPTDGMEAFDDYLDDIKDHLKLNYGFLTLRPHDQYTCEGSEGFRHFENVVCRFHKKAYVDKIICARWESIEKTGAVHWHWHCLFSFARRCSKSTIRQGLTRGIHSYLWENEVSTDFKKIPECDRATVCGYITKDDAATTGGEDSPPTSA